MGEPESRNVGGAEELDLKQLNFSVRLGKAIVTVDFDDTKFLLRYRPCTPGGKCYEWQCNADGSIEETGNPDKSPDKEPLDG